MQVKRVDHGVLVIRTSLVCPHWWTIRKSRDAEYTFSTAQEDLLRLLACKTCINMATILPMICSLMKVRKRSLTESALDKVSGLVGSFNFFRKKDEPAGMKSLVTFWDVTLATSIFFISPLRKLQHLLLFLFLYGFFLSTRFHSVNHAFEYAKHHNSYNFCAVLIVFSWNINAESLTYEKNLLDLRTR